MEMLFKLWNFLTTHLYEPVSKGIIGLWENVLVPFGHSFIQWIQDYLPLCSSFADFCTSVFRFKYQSRIYSFMLLLPIALVILLISRLPKIRRKKHGKDKRKA